MFDTVWERIRRVPSPINRRITQQSFGPTRRCMDVCSSGPGAQGGTDVWNPCRSRCPGATSGPQATQLEPKQKSGPACG